MRELELLTRSKLDVVCFINGAWVRDESRKLYLFVVLGDEQMHIGVFQVPTRLKFDDFFWRGNCADGNLKMRSTTLCKALFRGHKADYEVVAES